MLTAALSECAQALVKGQWRSSEPVKGPEKLRTPDTLVSETIQVLSIPLPRLCSKSKVSAAPRWVGKQASNTFIHPPDLLAQQSPLPHVMY